MQMMRATLWLRSDAKTREEVVDQIQDGNAGNVSIDQGERHESQRHRPDFDLRHKLLLFGAFSRHDETSDLNMVPTGERQGRGRG